MQPCVDVRDVWKCSRRELMDLLARGHRVDPRALVGAKYRGISLGLPSWVERLTWKKFRKEFYEDPATGRVVGRNVRLEQAGPVIPLGDPAGAPPAPILRAGAPVEFGPFVVKEIDPRAGYPCKHGVLLDYGPPHPLWHPLRRLRDPVVALNNASSELLLGASYLQIAGALVPTPSYFTLEREPA